MRMRMTATKLRKRRAEDAVVFVLGGDLRVPCALSTAVCDIPAAPGRGLLGPRLQMETETGDDW